MSGSDPKDWLCNEKRLHSLIPLVLTLRIGSGNEKHLHSLIPLFLIDSLLIRSDPKDWLGNEKHLHSLIPLVLTLRIGWVMRNVYTH